SFVDSLLPPMGSRAREVRLSGQVIQPTTGPSRLPPGAKVYNVRRLYKYANLRFSLLRRPITVRMNPAPDVVHWTIPLPIRVEGARNVYTIHDLIPLKLPYTTLDRKDVYYGLCKWIADSADLLCTVSDTTRADVLSLLGPDERKVVTTYQAVELGEKTQISDSDVAFYIGERYKLKHRGYFLFYGAIEPKKNVGRILEAFLGGRFDDDLAIVSSSGWLNKAELEMIRRLRTDGGAPSAKRKNLRHFEYASRHELLTLIRGARAVVFPSLYEGFGLPILEAMLCGTPVLTSNSGATAEIAGDAALLVDPADVTDIRHGMERLASDKVLWSSLRDKGLKRAATFSQAAYRERLKEAYERLEG
ncbi:MAG: glycosyltransferase family 4 protein, partial [Pseudomonadota bacterium]|nr:glycosyltransferase family 4 protein [Pseudomonadota bacterium]